MRRKHERGRGTSLTFEMPPEGVRSTCARRRGGQPNSLCNGWSILPTIIWRCAGHPRGASSDPRSEQSCQNGGQQHASRSELNFSATHGPQLERQDDLPKAGGTTLHHGAHWVFVSGSRTCSFDLASTQRLLCSVPAQSATFPNVDRILSRLSNDDEPEANLSTFASEMKTMAGLIDLATDTSLVLLDELGVSTQLVSSRWFNLLRIPTAARYQHTRGYCDSSCHLRASSPVQGAHHSDNPLYLSRLHPVSLSKLCLTSSAGKRRSTTK